MVASNNVAIFFIVDPVVHKTYQSIYVNVTVLVRGPLLGFTTSKLELQLTRNPELPFPN